MSAATEAYAALLERGCRCGTDRPADCTIHGPSDLRGLAAYFAAGCPGGFPLGATCAVCGTDRPNSIDSYSREKLHQIKELAEEALHAVDRACA